MFNEVNQKYANSALTQVMASTAPKEPATVAGLLTRMSAQASELYDLANFAMSLSDKIVGSRPEGETGGPNPMPSCAIGHMEDIASGFSAHMQRLRDALTRIERGLG